MVSVPESRTELSESSRPGVLESLEPPEALQPVRATTAAKVRTVALVRVLRFMCRFILMLSEWAGGAGLLTVG
jgi:hypothetical protein